MQRWIVGAFAMSCSRIRERPRTMKRAGPTRSGKQGKRLDALPLYEDLDKANPNEWLYAERLAVGLSVKADHVSDPAEIKALRTACATCRQARHRTGRPELLRSVPWPMLDPDAPIQIAPGSPASSLEQEAEKAFGVGDYATALAKYSQAAETDPHLYEAPLYAGDTAYSMKDFKTAVFWFARAIQVDPNRETAYRYWGDAILEPRKRSSRGSREICRRDYR